MWNDWSADRTLLLVLEQDGRRLLALSFSLFPDTIHPLLCDPLGT